MVLRTIVIAGLLSAGLNAAATAGPLDAESAKAYGKLRFLGSSYRTHIVSANRGDAEEEIIIVLRIDCGSHINANPASQPYLLPTTLTLGASHH